MLAAASCFRASAISSIQRARAAVPLGMDGARRLGARRASSKARTTRPLASLRACVTKHSRRHLAPRSARLRARRAFALRRTSRNSAVADRSALVVPNNLCGSRA